MRKLQRNGKDEDGGSYGQTFSSASKSAAAATIRHAHKLPRLANHTTAA
jgi:hypothetical protein